MYYMPYGDRSVEDADQNPRPHPCDDMDLSDSEEEEELIKKLKSGELCDTTARI